MVSKCIRHEASMDEYENQEEEGKEGKNEM
jgi:hypothetical protein